MVPNKQIYMNCRLHHNQLQILGVEVFAAMKNYL